MKKTSRVILIFLALSPPVSIAQEVKQIMPVPSNCGKIVQDNKSELPGAHFWWVVGSLGTRAVAAYADDNAYRRKWNGLVDNKDMKSVEGAVISYCQRYPLHSLSDATFDVYLQLGGVLWKSK